jgi:O-antigen biosynthesis protein WbqV
MLGLTKRCAEILVARTKTIERRQVLSVRFGNVLGSSGSVVPIFLRQIARGGPVTVTDPAMKRYFMSIKEASELVLVSCSLAHVGTPDKAGMNTATFLLDMGEPVRIVDLAEQLIAWCGWTPHVDVKIAFTGLRPGERLEEALVAAGENASPSLVKGVFQLDAEGQGFDHIDAALTGLRHAIDLDDKNLARQALYALINAPVRLAVDAA